LNVKVEGTAFAIEEDETVLSPAQITALADTETDTEEDGSASKVTEKTVSAEELPLTYSRIERKGEVTETDLQHKVEIGVRVAATALKLITWLAKSSV